MVIIIVIVLYLFYSLKLHVIIYSTFPLGVEVAMVYFYAEALFFQIQVY